MTPQEPLLEPRQMCMAHTMPCQNSIQSDVPVIDVTQARNDADGVSMQMCATDAAGYSISAVPFGH